MSAPERLSGAALAWPTQDPDTAVFGRYGSEDAVTLALLRRVLDGLRHLDPPARPHRAPFATRKQVVEMTDESNVDDEAAAHTAAVMALLRREREHRGWTRHDLASRTAGLTPEHLAALDDGATEPRMSDLLRICAALGLDPIAVLGEATGGSGGS